MKSFTAKTLWLLAGLLSFNAALLAQTPEAAEMKKLDGTWVGGVKGGGGGGGKGGKVGKGGGQGFMVSVTELVIKDGKITAKGDRGSDFGAGTYKLNLGANPKVLDASGTGGRSAGKTHLGIYKLNGDTLEWCVGNPGIARPKDYFTTPQVQFHMVLQRKKG
ncbi:MAG: TIGR03067 domain-containing protein [Verrucomicrobia bacterium]|nr:TIGR03067 domain-containing protein [Verrucomicrobiota bacterium]